MWIAPLFPSLHLEGGPRPEDQVPRDGLRVVFFWRISPKKNLDVALAVLAGLSFPVQFDIAGPVDDAVYWDKVQGLIGSLPPNIRARHLGAVEPAQVQTFLSSYHALLLPTRGENFGHVILEALAAGCPPIISDRTPWKDLNEKGCGWVVPLERQEGFAAALAELNAMTQEQRMCMRNAAREYARAYANDPKIKEANLRMFREAVGLAVPLEDSRLRMPDR